MTDGETWRGKCHAPLQSRSASAGWEFSQDVGNLRTDLEIREFA